MKYKMLPLLAAPFLLGSTLVKSANAETVITFDDIAALHDTIVPVPDGYGGANWSQGGWYYWDPAQFGSQEIFPPHSGSYDAFTQNNDSTIIFNAPTQVRGAWFETARSNDFTMTYFDANGNLLGSSGTIAPGNIKETFLASGYSGLVSSINVHIGGNHEFWVMDDLTLGSSISAPEPGPLASFIVGVVSLIGMSLIARRKRSLST